MATITDKRGRRFIADRRETVKVGEQMYDSTMRFFGVVKSVESAGSCTVIWSTASTGEYFDTQTVILPSPYLHEISRKPTIIIC